MYTYVYYTCVHTYCTTVPVGVHTVPGTRWTPLHYRVPQVVVHVVLHTCSMYKPYVVCTVLVLVVVHVVHVEPTPFELPAEPPVVLTVVLTDEGGPVAAPLGNGPTVSPMGVTACNGPTVSPMDASMAPRDTVWTVPP